MSWSDPIEVWWAETDAVPQGAVDVLAEQLDAPTRDAAARLVRPDDRARSVIAHSLARRVVAASTGRDPSALTLARHCAGCGGTDHGKPSFVGDGLPAISLSHAGPLAVVAVGTAGTEIGVDVELPGRGGWEQIRRHTFTDAEWDASASSADPDGARLMLWAIKEAAAKATGYGLELGLQRVDVGKYLPTAGGAWQQATITGEPGQPLVGQQLAIATLRAPVARGAALAVATLGEAPSLPPTLHEGSALLG